jgi:hypothetical protein
MFSSRLKKSGQRCEAMVLEREVTATTKGTPGSASAERVWSVRLEVRPGDGRAPFEITEKTGVAPGGQPPTTGTMVPAWVHPTKDKAHVEFNGTAALETGLNARLAASGMKVTIPEGITDPAEVQRLLTEQIEAQQRAQPDEPGDHDG